MTKKETSEINTYLRMIDYFYKKAQKINEENYDDIIDLDNDQLMTLVKTYSIFNYLPVLNSVKSKNLCRNYMYSIINVASCKSFYKHIGAKCVKANKRSNINKEQFFKLLSEETQ